VIALAGVVIFPVMTWLLFAAFSEGKPVGMLLFLIPFVLIGAGLLLFGLRGLVREMAYGHWNLDIPDGSVRPGSSISVTLRPGRKRLVRPEAELTCRLTCIASEVFSGRIEGLSTAERQVDRDERVTLWDKSWTVAPATIDPDAGLPLSLSIPANTAITNADSRDGSGVRWQLNVVIPSDGVQHEAMFEIPVR
jgi:hypothetical protein